MRNQISRLLQNSFRFQTKCFSKYLHQNHVNALRNVVGQENILQDGLESYNSDWLGTHLGMSAEMIRKNDFNFANSFISN